MQHQKIHRIYLPVTRAMVWLFASLVAIFNLYAPGMGAVGGVILATLTIYAIFLCETVVDFLDLYATNPTENFKASIFDEQIAQQLGCRKFRKILLF